MREQPVQSWGCRARGLMKRSDLLRNSSVMGRILNVPRARTDLFESQRASLTYELVRDGSDFSGRGLGRQRTFEQSVKRLEMGLHRAARQQADQRRKGRIIENR